MGAGVAIPYNMRATTIIYAGSSTPIRDTLRFGSDDKSFPVPEGAVLQFHVRLTDSDEESAVTGDADITNNQSGQVEFVPNKSCFPEPALMRAWWRLIIDNQPLDFPEFDLIVGQHAQGLTVKTGVIARRAAGMMPTTWEKLRQLPHVGDWELQNKIENLKHRFLTPAAYRPAESEHELDPVAVDWLAKKTILDTLPTAMDYWMNTRISAVTPQEHAVYADRLGALEKLGSVLAAECATQLDEFQSIVGPYTRLGVTSPKSDTEHLPYVTADPVGMPLGWGPYVPRVITRDYLPFRPPGYPFDWFQSPISL